MALTDPFHRTAEVATKFDPVMVSVMAGLPIVIEPGESVVTTGTGLTTVKVWPEDVPPAGAGVNTVIVYGPTVSRSLAGITALIVVLLVKVVTLGEPFH